MNSSSSKAFVTIAGSATVQAVGCVLIVMLLGNLNAVVDAVLHPDIPYFDREHLIVGGVTALVTAILLGFLALYLRHLHRALGRIQTLEAILPICGNCRRIRKADSNPKALEAWQPIEDYITEKTTSQFSHTLCPECAAKLYPEFIR